MTSTLTQALASHGPIANRDERVGLLKLFYPTVARLDRFGFGMLRLGLVVVLCWVGGLKAANFEAEGIVPFVANSPVMNFFYHHPAPEYCEHNPAGGLNVENRAWNETNGTYAFSYGLGCVIVAFGLLIAHHPVFPQIAAVGSFLVVLMAQGFHHAWCSDSGDGGLRKGLSQADRGELNYAGTRMKHVEDQRGF